MFYMPKYHNLPDGRQVFLRFPQPEQDAEEMLKFFNAVRAETPFLSEGPDDSLTVEKEAKHLAELNQSPTQMMVVALVGNEIAGNSFLRMNGKSRFAHRASLGIALRQKYWGLGLGKLLLQAVIDTAIQKGVEYLELEVVADNERAIGLYEKMGFETLCRLPDAIRWEDGSSHDLLTMRKTL